jgi:hypothetical protein
MGHARRDGKVSADTRFPTRNCAVDQGFASCPGGLMIGSPLGDKTATPPQYVACMAHPSMTTALVDDDNKESNVG